MTLTRLAPRPTMLCAVAVMVCVTARGQQLIGRVALQDAMVTGTLEVNDGQVMLTGGASIVAKDHTAELALVRGGVVAVCATSSLHVTSGASTGERTPLLFALDRGAIEVRTVVGPHDAVITPDLRMTAQASGPLDLRIRVTRNGDTCVESRGAGAPVMEVVEQFGDGLYRIGPGQHVLFEHGSVREVVDHESSPCGCPPTPVMSLADSGVSVAPGQAARAGSQAAQRPEDHPFPAAESQGLTPQTASGGTKVPQVPQAPPGQVHAQVTATMAYKAEGEAPETAVAGANAAGTGSAPAGSSQAGSSRTAGQGGKVGGGSEGVAKGGLASGSAQGGGGGSAASGGGSPTAEVKAPSAPAPPGAKDLAHRIGRFFKRVFGSR